MDKFKEKIRIHNELLKWWHCDFHTRKNEKCGLVFYVIVMLKLKFKKFTMKRII
jgi:hypothetical protein